ncbi:HIT family protein [Gemmatimonadota bacterium]
MPNREATENCIFCRIVAGEAPVSTIYEDDQVLGLMTIGPVTPGHAMVIPKEHVPYMSDLDPELGAHIFKVTQRVARAIRESGLRCEGINLFLADGEVAFQEVFHFHLHVFPRYEGDPFKLVADWDVHPPREELDESARLIRDAYHRLYGNGGD